MNAAYEAYRELREGQRPVDLCTGKGDCRGCGECCGRFLHLSAFDVVRLEGYAETHAIEVRPEAPGSVDLMCPFLTGGRECSVYPARPDICRVYRCDRHARGEIEMPAFWWAMDLADMREVADRLTDDGRKDG